MTRHIKHPAALLVVLALATSGCVTRQDAQRTPAGEPTPASTPDDGTGQSHLFENRLLEVAGSYESYGRLDTAARWAPFDCRAPLPATPIVSFSRSTDAGTHGQKLYSLFAKEHGPSGSYVSNGQPSPVGQVVVKESWVPEEVKDEGKPLEPVSRKVKARRGDAVVEVDDSFVPYARKDGRLYHAKEKGPLFVMFKLDPQTPGTDEGWVYGTVTPDGKRVTSVGRVESCMQCHKDAPHDRLFGPPEAK
jgi:hypothetical protein